MNVIHRDLKPENFLLSDKSEDAKLKATDFGLSVFFKDNQSFRDIVGSAYYVAPEVRRAVQAAGAQAGRQCSTGQPGVVLHGAKQPQQLSAVARQPSGAATRCKLDNAACWQHWKTHM